MSDEYEIKKKKVKEISSRWNGLGEKWQHDKIETREKFEKGDMVCSEFDIKNIGIVQDVDKAGINLSVYWIKDKVITNRPRWHLQPIKKKEKRE
tara:strand:+ start:1208 stop:1489 length:282 start_codon:yes stop_codon:yes gene_type:complete